MDTVVRTLGGAGSGLTVGAPARRLGGTYAETARLRVQQLPPRREGRLVGEGPRVRGDRHLSPRGRGLPSQEPDREISLPGNRRRHLPWRIEGDPQLPRRRVPRRAVASGESVGTGTSARADGGNRPLPRVAGPKPLSGGVLGGRKGQRRGEEHGARGVGARAHGTEEAGLL